MPILATRDAVLDSYCTRLTNYVATSDVTSHVAQYLVLGPVPGLPGSVFARGLRHDNLVVVTRTGTRFVRGKGAQVRVRISFARDTGDAAGTLAFDADHIGGVAPAHLFAGNR